VVIPTGSLQQMVSTLEFVQHHIAVNTSSCSGGNCFPYDNLKIFSFSSQTHPTNTRGGKANDRACGHAWWTRDTQWTAVPLTETAGSKVQIQHGGCLFSS